MDLKKLSIIADSAKPATPAPKVTAAKRRLTDSFKKLKRRIKDDLEGTESTEEVIDVVQNYLAEAPADEVLQATVEVLGEVVDKLEELATEEVVETEDKPE